MWYYNYRRNDCFFEPENVNKNPGILREKVFFLPTLLKRDALSVRGVYASFPLRTASGHIKQTGSDPPAAAGRNSTYINDYSGFFSFVKNGKTTKISGGILPPLILIKPLSFYPIRKITIL